MKPKVIDIFLAFNPVTIQCDHRLRPFDRAFFDARSATTYVAEMTIQHPELTMIVARFDCEVPESQINA